MNTYRAENKFAFKIHTSTHGDFIVTLEHLKNVAWREYCIEANIIPLCFLTK